MVSLAIPRVRRNLPTTAATPAPAPQMDPGLVPRWPETCSPGDTKTADDGCNTCSCLAGGTWACTDMACTETCTPGDTKTADDGCNSCTCSDDGSWACTEMACDPTGCTYDGAAYEQGASFPSTDGCNTCTCTNGLVACTARACLECPAPAELDPETGCVAVIVYAKDPASGQCCQYGCPALAPSGWTQYYSLEECSSAS